MSDMITAEEAQKLLDREGDYTDQSLECASENLARTVIALHAQLADAKAAQAMVVERFRHDLQFMVDSIAEDKAYVADKYPALFKTIQARRAEMGTLGGVQVFGEIARDLLALADTDGLALGQALRAERDEWKRRAIEAEAFRNPVIGDWWREQGNRAEAAEADRDRLAAAKAALEAQVGALRLQLDQKDALYDSGFQAGVKLGWNLGVSGDEAGFQAATSSTEHVAELKRIRAALAEVQARDERDEGAKG